MKNILFVCSANKQRSKTAEDYFASKYSNYHFDSVGTNQKICNKEGTNFIMEEHLIWADIVYVMEQRHKKQINEHTERKYHHKITVLNIPDRFKYYQKELIEILEEKIQL